MATQDEIAILIKSLFDPKGAQEAQKAIDALSKAGKSGTGLSKTANDDAAALAKVQQAAANAATASQKLATEQQRTAAATAQAAAAQTRAEKAALALAQAQQKAADSGSYFDKVAQSVQSGIAGIVGPAATATAALAALKGAVDLAQVGASIQSVEQSFRSLSAAGGQSADTLLSKMNAAAQGTISDAKLMQSANTGLLLTSGKIAQDLPRIIEIARASAKATGQEVGFVFDSLVRGIARGSPMIIDNAGITLNASEAFETYAKSIGKSAEQLTKSEQQQATLNAVVAAGNEIIAKTGSGAEGNAEKFARLGTALENLKNKGAAGLADVLAPVAGAIADVANVADGSEGSFERAAAGAATFLQTLQGFGPTTEAQRAANEDFAGSIARGNDAILQWYASISGATIGATTNTAATTQNAAAQQQAAAATMIAADADDRRAAAAVTAAQVTQAEADASLLDKAAKEAQTAQTELLNYQTRTAAEAFMALNPNITGSGLASAVAAGQISQAVAQYISMTLAAAQARVTLANLQAQAGMSPALKAAATAAGGGDVGRYITTPVDPKAKAEGEANVKRLRELNAQEKAHADAVRASTMTNGTAAQKQALLNKEYQDAARIYGDNSTQAINAKTALDQLTAQQVKGGTSRASAAQAGADKLTQIEANTGSKLADIVQNAQQKITEITEREAAKQAEALRRLNEAIATSAADRRVSSEADDLDLIGVKDKKQAEKLNDRERAEADARRREEQAASEARARAEAGEAETAEKIYGIREKQIDSQQQLDEKYYERQRELAGDDAAQEALKTQYDEATRANEEAAATRIAIAEAEAAQKRQAVEAEKAEVIAAAEDQANKVVAAASRSAEGVKKATADARAKAVSDLQAIGNAVNAIPTSKTVTITVSQSGDVAASSAGGGAAGGTKAAGGGTFVTHGRTSLTVGDNPGGVEVVSVTPVSGRGRTSVGGGMARLAGGGVVVVDAGGGYTTPIAGAGSGKGGGSGKGAAGGKGTADLKKAVEEQKAVVELLKALIDLRGQLEAAANQQPFNIGLIKGLASRAALFVEIVKGHLVPTTKKESEGFKAYTDTVSGAIDLLKDVADLRHSLQENAGDQPFDIGLIRGLANRAKLFVGIVRAQLVPTTEVESDLFGSYADVVGSTVGILKDVADLRGTLSEGTGTAFDLAAVNKLADDSARIVQIVRSRAIPMAEAESDALSRYSDAVGSSVSTLKDVSELTGKMFADYSSPSDAQIGMLVKDANRVARGVATAAATYSKEGLEGAKAFSDAVGGTFSAFKDGLLFFQALNSGDFVLDPANLAKFERATAMTLDVTKRLGAQAAAIPAGDITALQTTTAALSAQAEALIRLAAVPFGDIVSGAQGLASNGGALLGGAGGTTNIYNTFNLPQGTTQQIAYAVIDILNTQTGLRR